MSKRPTETDTTTYTAPGGYTVTDFHGWFTFEYGIKTNAQMDLIRRWEALAKSYIANTVDIDQSLAVLAVAKRRRVYRDIMARAAHLADYDRKVSYVDIVKVLDEHCTEYDYRKIMKADKARQAAK